MSFPAHDWQFWAVTAAFVLAVVWLTRGVIARVVFRRKPSPGTRKAVLTVSAKPHARSTKPHGDDSRIRE